MEQKIKVLLAEDEPSLALIVKESLETRNFLVTVSKNGVEAQKTFEKESFDVLIFDVMMPEKDGFTLAQEIRKHNKTIPILFLTAKSQTHDVVQGFTIGGNDYLKKPFSLEELIVRINALLNRMNLSFQSEIINIGNYIFNIQKQILSTNKIQHNLTYREVEVLQILVINKNNLVEKSYILNKIWGTNDFFSGRSLDVFITKLRKKLAEDSAIQIVNIRGFGYKIVF